MFTNIFYKHFFNIFYKHFLQTFVTNIFYKHLLLTFFTNIFYKHFLQTFPTNIYNKHFPQTCFYKHFLQTFSTIIFHKHFLQTFPPHIFYKHFPHAIFTNISPKHLPQTFFYKHCSQTFFYKHFFTIICFHAALLGDVRVGPGITTAAALLGLYRVDPCFGLCFLFLARAASHQHGAKKKHTLPKPTRPPASAGSCRHVLAGIFCPAIFVWQFFAGILAGIFAHRAHTGPVENFASVSPL